MGNVKLPSWNLKWLYTGRFIFDDVLSPGRQLAYTEIFSKTNEIYTCGVRIKIGCEEDCSFNKSGPWEVFNEQINSTESVGRTQNTVSPTNSNPIVNCRQSSGRGKRKSHRSSKALLTMSATNLGFYFGERDDLKHKSTKCCVFIHWWVWPQINYISSF